MNHVIDIDECYLARIGVVTLNLKSMIADGEEHLRESKQLKTIGYVDEYLTMHYFRNLSQR